ncbi:alpha/beta hydrolase [Kaistia sp. 32K]|uniref:alpha/beta fold hydrolase n=1 Tax=Kaistia sp. 32K TaxID=2795690 RepID=UPI0019169E30|nr:alpha/beta hydrolase [Kaistia sp. 32K]BCP52991.1 alpha/beta hydrolase [Kaistia sp. 32K]
MTILFLPGAGGSASFWSAVAERLDLDEPAVFFAWPGLGNEPHDPDVRSIDDLVARVLDALTEPSVLVAQSMGGYVAMQVALAAPERVRGIVLAVTSAGVPMRELGASDWRASYQASFPQAADWIAGPTEDLTTRLAEVSAPTLLIWGDSDPISPVAIGERLLGLLPDAELHVLPGADHDLAITHADDVARLVQAHIGKLTQAASE